MVKAPQKAIKPDKIQQALIENFITLQKVMTNLSIKFDSLSDQISKLLDLFEISAKAMAEKDFETKEDIFSPKAEQDFKDKTFTNKTNEELTEKFNILLEQNKTIARGFTLMNEKIEELFNNSKTKFELEGPLTNTEQSLLREKQTLENFKPREYY